MPSSTPPVFSIVIPTYKDTLSLLSCLRCLLHQSFDPSMYEIRVINNDPSIRFDHFKTVIKNACEDSNVSVYVHTETKRGSYAARNCGVSNARGAIVAFTDSDCLPSKHWLTNSKPCHGKADVWFGATAKITKTTILSDYAL